MQKYTDINIDKYSSMLTNVAINNDNTVMLVKFTGAYGYGSKGNGDGIFMFSMLAAYYYIFEPVTIILDLRELEYKWGNTIFRSINFFDEIGRDIDEKEKKVIIIISEENEVEIKLTEPLFNHGKREYCRSFEDAEQISLKTVQDYLGDI